MKFIYGKQDWKTFERGEENCYLMTNGLGGFSSLTMIGSCSRNDHTLLMACVKSPNHRYNMIHRLEELLCFDSGKSENIHISSQSYADGELKKEEIKAAEDGYLYQTSFSFADYPEWRYLVNGVEVVKSIIMTQGVNTIGISYKIRNRSDNSVTLKVLPHLQFIPKGSLLSKEQEFALEGSSIESNGYKLYFKTNGEYSEIPTIFHDNLYYAYDAYDGRRITGCSVVNHQVCLTISSGEEKELELVYGMTSALPDIKEMFRDNMQYRQTLAKQADFKNEIADMLAKSANQFVSYRESTDNQTLLAGFPFFEDWGRDTMIAINGCCLATCQFNTARSILQTFTAYCRKGLMPNLFPEGKESPGYNTVDASLLFILAVYEYYQKTQDSDFVKNIYAMMADIINWYCKGTDYGIKMDSDGLISAGQGYDQVTWMDVRIGDILPTPRHGKPVEINAYWYNALCIMEEFKKLGIEDEIDYGAIAAKVKESFSKFWNEDTGCLKDVLSGTEADNQIRCNQIWAVSLPFSILQLEKEKQVVDVVFRKLYTPYGLRTLAPDDKEFHSFYGGEQMERDLAYHQGTVWTFPLGGYYLAYLKVHDYSTETKNYVREQLSCMEAALREGCIGQLPEIYDGLNPVSSKGCFAQAWSVGEILRVYDALRD
ncbi:MAG: amylo-alpha-1,6-glucosidase [Butyrivibrio sp.]|nr:amylo-alpha-1,6-glucosidase [Butyrivibrio sp.]